MSNFENKTTTEIFTANKSKEVVAEFAGMQDLSAFDNAPEKLTNLLNAIESLNDVPSHMDKYTVDQLHQSAGMVRYFKLQEGCSPYTAMMDDLDMFFDNTRDDDACGD